ncbi:9616_t:CDS:2, partial [Rhizophagus irregularis]
FNDGYKAIYSLRALGALHENPITDEDTAELNFALAENLNTIDINTVTWENPVTRKHKTGIFSNDLCQQLKASDDYNALDEDDNWFNNGYLTDVVIPLIRAAIKDIPNFNYMRVTTSEMESKNSKERWKLQKCSSFGKKPDAMIIATICNIEFEIMFLEGSRLVADKGKRHSDSVKLWRGSNDGIWLASRRCKLK